ncbi:hypothetical protein [Asticcacaulis sp. AC402]|uniref:hypothetical protein n=1 Tax=Asticcacaulis sp. AC402 TaxID=1282361 RepID=UPI0003C40D77|nr:hypothetical protein [Asticcacaulis sp. AC402]ESQ75762.1 hypothetical protein ABAC402_07290 [Asticcacaulis sp. AC402]
MIAMAADAFWFEPRSTVVSEFNVEVPAWPGNTETLQVVQLSDIHVDDVHMPPERVRDIAKRVEGRKPDVILLTGDYIGGDVLKGRKEFGARPLRSPENVALPAGAATLTLTHNAGQVRLPLIGAPVRVVRHTEDTADGYEVINNRILIVTRGLGSSGLPVRFGAPPQIMVLNIKPGTTAKVTERH